MRNLLKNTIGSTASMNVFVCLTSIVTEHAVFSNITSIWGKILEKYGTIRKQSEGYQTIRWHCERLCTSNWQFFFCLFFKLGVNACQLWNEWSSVSFTYKSWGCFKDEHISSANNTHMCIPCRSTDAFGLNYVHSLPQLLQLSLVRYRPWAGKRE